MQITTVFSDLLLCIVSFWIAVGLNRSHTFARSAAAWGIVVIAVAAGLGSIHFLGIGTLDPVYHFFVALSKFGGVPMIGVAYLHLGFTKIKDCMLLPIFGAFFLLFLLFHYFMPVPALATILPGAGMIVVIITGFKKISAQREASLLGISGAVLFILAGLVVGTTGTIGPVLKVDIFHIIIALAVYCLGTSIRKLA